MNRWRWWASVPFVVIGVAAIVRAHGVAVGDFNANGMTTDWWGWRNATLWGGLWGVWGGLAVLAGMFPSSRPLRMAAAVSGVVLLYTWALLVWFQSGEDFTNVTMWGFIAFGTLVAWCWGMPSAPLEREHRRVR